MKKMLLATALILFFVPGFGQDLFINEFLASNDACCADENGEFDDFIEIYNGGTEAVDIGGMYITDDLAAPTEYQIPDTAPDSTTIESGGFLLLWADKESEQGILHVEIKLGGGGEQIGLFASDGVTPIDTLTFGEQTTDVSKGRNPDGGETWEFFTSPTPGATNGGASVSDPVNLPEAVALEKNYPNPFNPTTTIRFSLEAHGDVSLQIYDVSGRLVETLVSSRMEAGEYNVEWNAVSHPSGIYFYSLTSGGEQITKKMLFLK